MFFVKLLSSFFIAISLFYPFLCCNPTQSSEISKKGIINFPLPPSDQILKKREAKHLSKHQIDNFFTPSSCSVDHLAGNFEIGQAEVQVEPKKEANKEKIKVQNKIRYFRL